MILYESYHQRNDKTVYRAVSSSVLNRKYLAIIENVLTLAMLSLAMLPTNNVVLVKSVIRPINFKKKKKKYRKDFWLWKTNMIIIARKVIFGTAVSSYRDYVALSQHRLSEFDGTDPETRCAMLVKIFYSSMIFLLFCYVWILRTLMTFTAFSLSRALLFYSRILWSIIIPVRIILYINFPE